MRDRSSGHGGNRGTRTLERMTKSTVWTILAVIIAIIVAWVLVDVLFAVLGFVLKLVIVAAVAVVVYIGVRALMRPGSD